MGPLYKHIFPPALAPYLSFVGLPWMVHFWTSCQIFNLFSTCASLVVKLFAFRWRQAPLFAVFELQSQWIAGVLSGRIGLPSQEEMMADVEAFCSSLEASGTPKRYTHKLGDYEAS